MKIDNRATAKIVSKNSPKQCLQNRSRPVLRDGDRPWPAGLLVGVTGFEPMASSSRTKRATKLRHTPMVLRKSTACLRWDQSGYAISAE
jgi:hypothetical protein